MDMRQEPLACHFCGAGPIVATALIGSMFDTPTRVPVCASCATPGEIEQAADDAATVAKLRARRQD